MRRTGLFSHVFIVLFSSLRFVFGPCALQALDLVDQRSVTCVSSPSGRSVFQVRCWLTHGSSRLCFRPRPFLNTLLYFGVIFLVMNSALSKPSGELSLHQALLGDPEGHEPSEFISGRGHTVQMWRHVLLPGKQQTYVLPSPQVSLHLSLLSVNSFQFIGIFLQNLFWLWQKEQTTVVVNFEFHHIAAEIIK